MRRQQTGFSLIELMVTLTVAGVVLAYGVPSFNAQAKNSKLTGAVNQLISAMHVSRSESSKRRVPVGMCASTNALDLGAEACSATASWSDGWFVFADLSGDSIFNPGEPILQRQETQKGGLIVLGDDEIAQTIVYLPSGFAQLPLNTTSSRFIVYCDPDGDDRFSRVLSLSNSGRPQIVSRDNVTSGAPSCGTI